MEASSAMLSAGGLVNEGKRWESTGLDASTTVGLNKSEAQTNGRARNDVPEELWGSTGTSMLPIHPSLIGTSLPKSRNVGEI